jgi:hypothetical protein
MISVDHALDGWVVGLRPSMVNIITPETVQDIEGSPFLQIVRDSSLDNSAKPSLLRLWHPLPPSIVFHHRGYTLQGSTIAAIPRLYIPHNRLSSSTSSFPQLRQPADANANRHKRRLGGLKCYMVQILRRQAGGRGRILPPPPGVISFCRLRRQSRHLCLKV